MSQKNKRIIGLVITILVVAFSFTTTFQSFVNFPKEIRMFESTVKQLKLSLPFSATVISSNLNVLEVNGHKQNFTADLINPLTVKPITEGESKLTLKLFGVIPFKAVNVNVLKDIKVIPGGQTI